MWKPVLPPAPHPGFTQRFHAANGSRSFRPWLIRDHTEIGFLRARRILTLVPGIVGDTVWWQDGRIQGVGSAAEMDRAAPRHVPRLERKGVNGAPATGWMSEERIGFLEAVAGYTVGAAHAAGVGHRRGVLAPGFDADIVAWALDPAAERNDGEAFR